MINYPEVIETIKKEDNTYLIYNILKKKPILPIELINLIFKILYQIGCQILYDGTIIDFYDNSKRGQVIFKSYPYNKECVLKRKLSNPYILSVNINNNIQILDSNLFFNSIYLKEIKLSNKVKYILNNVYENCYNLENIKLPKNLKYLGDSVFKNCKNLKKIKFNNNLRYVGSNILINTKITDIIIPKNIRVLDRYCFVNMEYLKTIKIENKFSINCNDIQFWDDKNDDYIIQEHLSVIKNPETNNILIIHQGAFYCNNDNLEKIIIYKSRKEIGEDNWNYIFPKDTFYWNENIILKDGFDEYIYTKK